MKLSFLFCVYYFIILNTLLLTGLIGYGDDTGVFDIPLRILSGALTANGDFPLWYPQAGDGFPQWSLEYTPWVANPMGTALGVWRAYDHMTFAVENAIWRTVGFLGAYLFARLWGVVPVGAIAVAAIYVGSGTMSRASIAFATLIGQMVAPWVLVGGSLAIHAPSWPRVVRAGAVLGLVLGCLVWFAYPGTWVSAPVVSGPLLIALAATQHKGLRKLAVAVGIAAAVALSLAAPLVSETISGSAGQVSPTYRAVESWMLVGHVRAVDLMGILLVNPSYILDGASDALQPLYAGTLPPLMLLATVGGLPHVSRRVMIALSLASALILANSQNWTLWDHPLFRDLSPPSSLLAALDAMTLPAVVLLPTCLVSLAWRSPFPLRTVDRAMLLGAAWVALIATDNPFSNLLRFHVPPFNLVRHNMLFFWLVALVLATVAWRRLDVVLAWLPDTSARPPTSHAGDTAQEAPGTARDGVLAVRNFASRFGVVGVGMLAIVALVGISTGDAKGTTDHAFVGLPQLAWQVAIVIMALTTIGVMAQTSRKTGTLDTAWLLKANALGAVGLALIAALIAAFARSRGVVYPRIPLTDTTELLIDLLHVVLVLVGAVVIFRTVRDRAVARVLVACLMVLDAAVATSRYYSDSERISPPHAGWPFTWEVIAHGKAESLFLPDRGDGSRKDHFWQPFTGSFRPPPTVNRLRVDWGDAYEVWVHFPTHWSVAPGNPSVSVTREALNQLVTATATKRQPTWGVSAANTGGRAFKVAPASTVDPRAIQHNACDGPVATGATDDVSSAGRVTRLLATTVDVTFTADCDRLLVFTDSWAPGWSATIDGTPTPVLLINDAIRGVMVPTGTHALSWHYRPRFLGPLLALLATGLAVSGILITAPWWARRITLRLPSWVEQLLSFDPAPITPALIPTLATPTAELVTSLPHAEVETPPDRPAVADTTWPRVARTALPLVGIAGLVTLSLVAYDASIDGPAEQFRLFLLRSLLAGLWAWVVVAGWTGYRSLVGPALTLLVMLPPTGLQLARHLDPITRGAPVVTVVTDFRVGTWRDEWEVTGSSNAKVSETPDGIMLRSDGAMASAIAHDISDVGPTLWPWWRRPLGTPRAEIVITWTGRISRNGPYYSIAKLGRLTIQAISGGLLVTAPTLGGDVKGDFVATDAGSGNTATWTIISRPEGSSFAIDGRVAWEGGPPGTAERVTLGDPSRDPEHGGTMTITSASVGQRVTFRDP